MGALAARVPDRLPLALGTVTVGAWWLLLLGPGRGSRAFCSSAAPWWRPTADSLDVELLLNPPALLAADWLLMLAAMMPPLLFVPLRHVRERSFATRRRRAMVLFAVAYTAVWIAAGAALSALSIPLRMTAPFSLVPLGIAAAAALIWQVSPAKQRCLNRCHRRPPLAAFGRAAERDALQYGATYGGWCIGSCWALMLLPLLVGRGHLAAMAVISFLVIAERLERPEPPAWRWRGPAKALRIAAAQARMRLIPPQVRKVA